MRTACRAIGTVAIAATVVGAALVAVNPHTARACTCPPPTGDADDVAVAFVGGQWRKTTPMLARK